MKPAIFIVIKSIIHHTCSQLQLTTLKYNKYSGYATITHPFHPLRGQRFQILSTKNLNSRNILSLKASQGTLAILRDWTDRADPNPYQVLTDVLPILSFSHLQQLVKLVTNIDQTANIKEVDQ